MPETPAHLAERLRLEGQKTLEFFRSLSEESWEQTVYSEGAAWKVRSVLAHFVAAETGMLALIRAILAGGAGVPEDFNLDAYNERKAAALEDRTISDLLAQFEAVRSQTAALAAGLTGADLQRQGRHPWLGLASLEDILKLLYRHNQIHQRDIRKSALHPEKLE